MTDIYKNTKDVLKAFRNENEQRLQNHLNSLYLISLSAISTTPSLLGKTWSNGVCHRLLIVPFALLLSHSCMSSLVVKHI